MVALLVFDWGLKLVLTFLLIVPRNVGSSSVGRFIQQCEAVLIFSTHRHWCSSLPLPIIVVVSLDIVVLYNNSFFSTVSASSNVGSRSTGKCCCACYLLWLVLYVVTLCATMTHHFVVFTAFPNTCRPPATPWGTIVVSNPFKIPFVNRELEISHVLESHFQNYQYAYGAAAQKPYLLLGLTSQGKKLQEK